MADHGAGHERPDAVELVNGASRRGHGQVHVFVVFRRCSSMCSRSPSGCQPTPGGRDWPGCSARSPRAPLRHPGAQHAGKAAQGRARRPGRAAGTPPACAQRTAPSSGRSTCPSLPSSTPGLPGGPGLSAGEQPPPSGRRWGRSCSCCRPRAARPWPPISVHVEHLLSGRQQLLGEQVTQPRPCATLCGYRSRSSPLLRPQCQWPPCLVMVSYRVGMSDLRCQRSDLFCSGIIAAIPSIEESLTSGSLVVLDPSLISSEGQGSGR